MTKQEFAKFVEQKNSEETTSPAINWESQKLEWLKQLAKFYAQVENYLREYIKSDKIRIKKSSVSINEPHIGRYKAEARDIVRKLPEIVCYTPQDEQMWNTAYSEYKKIVCNKAAKFS